jgi:hypothetical protein
MMGDRRVATAEPARPGSILPSAWRSSVADATRRCWVNSPPWAEAPWLPSALRYAMLSSGLDQRSYILSLAGGIGLVGTRSGGGASTGTKRDASFSGEGEERIPGHSDAPCAPEPGWGRAVPTPIQGQAVSAGRCAAARAGEHGTGQVNAHKPKRMSGLRLPICVHLAPSVVQGLACCFAVFSGTRLRESSVRSVMFIGDEAPTHHPSSVRSGM